MVAARQSCTCPCGKQSNKRPCQIGLTPIWPFLCRLMVWTWMAVLLTNEPVKKYLLLACHCHFKSPTETSNSKQDTDFLQSNSTPPTALQPLPKACTCIPNPKTCGEGKKTSFWLRPENHTFSIIVRNSTSTLDPATPKAERVAGQLGVVEVRGEGSEDGQHRALDPQQGCSGMPLWGPTAHKVSGNLVQP